MDYDRARANALRLIADAGALATVYQSSASTYDPLADIETNAETSFTIPCVVLPIGRDDEQTAADMLTLDRKAKLLMPAVPAGTPSSGDRVIIPGDTARWTIAEVKTLRPDGTAIMHTCFITRGGS
ncbi:MAG TPA: hypothetical protein VNJ04_09780 [Gemmatimonadaceae bacterium]|nr:hypothetical protein [Gemmatimonadaceae bacterium]